MKLIRILSAADKVVAVNEGEEFELTGAIRDSFEHKFHSMTADGYEMPALGVSLDAMVKTAMAEGLWLKFDYSRTKTHREMPFDRLAVQLRPEYSGLEFVRGNGGTYSGRDYYYSLKKGQTAAELCEFLKGAGK